MRGLVSWLGVLLVAAPGWARSLPHYDLDSLTWLSRHVVEAEVVAGNGIRVLRSFHGGLAKGLEVPLPDHVLRFKKRGKGLGSNGAALSEKERLFVFLRESKAGKLTPVPSGMWLVFDGRVIAPVQYSNPGWYSWLLDRGGPAVEQFRDGLPARIRAAWALKQRLAVPPTRQDIAWMLETLRRRNRHAVTWRNVDHVGDQICRQLASLRAFNALAEALRICRGYTERLTLGTGFGTAAGREFLLATIANRDAERETRLECATILHYAGAIYRSRVVSPESRARQSRGEPDEANSHYLTRLARVAREVQKLEGLCIQICTQLKWLVGAARDHDQVRIDAEGAADVLIKLHNEAKSERIRYHAALVLARLGMATLRRVSSSAGHVVGIVEAPAENAGRAAGHIACGFRYHSLTTVTRGVLVLEGNGHSLRIPIDLKLRRGQRGGRSIHAPLPTHLEPGRYRVFVRLYLDEYHVSDSYAWTTDLPQRSPPVR